MDDNKSFLDVARSLLERGGLRVVGVATSTAEALRSAEQLRPDVVLVDIVLAGESGFELARRLAEHEEGGGPAAIPDLDSCRRGLRGADHREPRDGVPAEVGAVGGRGSAGRRRRLGSVIHRSRRPIPPTLGDFLTYAVTFSPKVVIGQLLSHTHNVPMRSQPPKCFATGDRRQVQTRLTQSSWRSYRPAACSSRLKAARYRP